jgi:multidrug resistance efflux pump
VGALRVKESAYAIRESEVAEAVGTADVRSAMLQEQAKLLTLSLKEEEAKVAARDEMLRSLQQELQSQRSRLNELEQRGALAQHGQARAEAAKQHAEAERSELHEKLTLAMMEVNARAERLEHSQAQVAASVRRAAGHGTPARLPAPCDSSNRCRPRAPTLRT